VDISPVGPFPKPVRWHIVERTSNGATVYIVDAKTYWEARIAAREINPLIEPDGCMFFANVTLRKKKQ